MIALSLGALLARPYMPEWTFKFVMNQIEKDNYAIVFESPEIELDEMQEELLKKVLETLSYEVQGSRIEGDLAYVTVDFTFMDLGQLILNNYQRLIEIVLGDFTDIFDHLMSGSLEQVMIQGLLTLLEDDGIEIPLMVKEVDVLLERSGLFWTPVITEEWLEAVFELDQLELNLENFLQ